MNRRTRDFWSKNLFFLILLLYPTKPTNAYQGAGEFSAPFRLEADGQVIDTGLLTPNAHASPELNDIDTDGDLDLMVGDFSGRFTLFENTGSKQTPCYTKRGFLKAAEKDARVPIYCCIASSPRMADLDGDAVPDLISGSYDPGVIYWFKGLGGHQFAKSEKMRDRNGVALVHHPVDFVRSRTSRDMQEMSASFGSWPAVVDWDGDGDLDILIGSFKGEVWLRENEGNSVKAEYSANSLRLECIDGPIKVLGHAHPVVADWDRDGMWDIVVGSADGSVVWHRNIGTMKHPQFGAFQWLIPPASKSKNLVQVITPGKTPQPGVRAQICVADYNGDGWPDLLVGDYSECKWQRQLSEAELADYAKNTDRLKCCQQKLGELTSTSQQDETRAAIENELIECAEIDKGYFQTVRNASFIWVYLRQIADGTRQQSTPADFEKNDIADPASSQGADTESRSIKSYPVRCEVRTESLADQPDSIRLTMELEIDEPWFIYAESTSAHVGEPLKIELELPTGFSSVGEWDRPKPEIEVKKSNTQVHRKKATWTIVLVRDRTKKLEDDLGIRVRLQTCTSDTCLPATTIVKSIRPADLD